MALLNCPECAKKISDKALSCPDCGYPVSLSKTEDEHTNGEWSKKILADSSGDTANIGQENNKKRLADSSRNFIEESRSKLVVLLLSAFIFFWTAHLALSFLPQSKRSIFGFTELSAIDGTYSLWRASNALGQFIPIAVAVLIIFESIKKLRYSQIQLKSLYVLLPSLTAAGILAPAWFEAKFFKPENYNPLLWRLSQSLIIPNQTGFYSVRSNCKPLPPEGQGFGFLGFGYQCHFIISNTISVILAFVISAYFAFKLLNSEQSFSPLQTKPIGETPILTRRFNRKIVFLSFTLVLSLIAIVGSSLRIIKQDAALESINVSSYSPTESVNENPCDIDNLSTKGKGSILDRLNECTNLKWEQDPFIDVRKKREVVYFGSQGEVSATNSGLACAAYVYENEQAAQEDTDSTLKFAKGDFKSWTIEDKRTRKGIIFIEWQDSYSNGCREAGEVMGWELTD